LKDVQI
jgi:hypothetical protein